MRVLYQRTLFSSYCTAITTTQQQHLGTGNTSIVNKDHSSADPAKPSYGTQKLQCIGMTKAASPENINRVTYARDFMLGLAYPLGLLSDGAMAHCHQLPRTRN